MCVCTPPVPIYGNLHQCTVLRAQAAVQKDWLIITGRQGCLTKGENGAVSFVLLVFRILSALGKCSGLLCTGLCGSGCASGDWNLPYSHRINYCYADSVLCSLQEQQFLLANQRQQFRRLCAQLAVTTPGSLQ